MAVSWIGQTLNGRYRIEEMLGQGGMSAVYKATDPNLRRVVAIKMIHPHLSSNPDFVRRFEEEAAAVAQMRHPNIVQVFDFNHDNGVYYMVLEFLPGETLQDRLDRLEKQGRRLSLQEAIEFIIQVGEASQYAHDRGMVHRDIKPANIMLDIYGKAILMDFGIARIVGGQLHTATGAVVGTAMYMSPEQIVGEKVDERSDIYSLGVTLFEALSGKPPFQSDSAMTLMMMHMNDPVPDLRELQPDIPYSLVRVVEKSLEKNRANRYQSMREMVNALRTLQARLAGNAQPEPVEPEDIPAQPVDSFGSTPATIPPQDVPAKKASQSSSSQPVVPQTFPSTPAGSQSGQARYVPDEDATIAEPVPLRQGTQPPVYEGTMDDPLPVSVRETLRRSATESALPAPASKEGFFTSSRLITAGIVIGLIALLLIGYSLLGGQQTATATNTPPAQVVAAASSPTVDPNVIFTQAVRTMQAEQTKTAANPAASTPVLPTNTPAPTDTPAPQFTPTPTIPLGVPYYARINSIAVEGGVYIVEYETFEFEEKAGSLHIHFFYDTVRPENAGYPGMGPWIMYTGPRPFKGYTVASRPANANRMCVAVANVDHSIQPNSGMCFDLPSP